MSALARYFNAHDKKVSGYDKSKTPLTEKLEKEGIAIHYKDDISQIKTEVKEILKAYGHGSGHVFNLGHGIHPTINPEHVAALVDAVHAESVQYHQ